MDNILGMSADNIFAIVIILMLIILGIVTFHFYTYVTVGKKSVICCAYFQLLPKHKFVKSIIIL
jgi:hypothetical protein